MKELHLNVLHDTKKAADFPLVGLGIMSVTQQFASLA